jgi:membrane protease YdiL (CAAX protease family)
MSTKNNVINTNYEANKSDIPQYRLPMILFMFVWPAAWFMFLIWVVRPLLFGTPAPGEFLPTWIFFGIAALGNTAELIVALVVLRREGYKLTLRDLRDRARLRWPRGWRKWGLVLVAFALLAVGMQIGSPLATVPGFIPPPWWPPMTNPTVEITAPGELFPDITLAGNYLFLAVYVVYGTVFNVIGEELYYRSMLLPKMRGVFGKWDWVANGILFTLKHVYQRWAVWPSGFVTDLGFALLGGPVGSVWLAMILHWVGNYLFGLIAGIPLIFGG